MIFFKMLNKKIYIAFGEKTPSSFKGFQKDGVLQTKIRM